MSELLRNYLGKECIIYTINSQLTGTISDVADGWISVQNNKNVEIINVDYIIRVREYPLRKTGKKKSRITD